MAQTTQKTTGVLDRAAAAAGGINRRKLAWGGLALGAVILLAVNLIASSALRDARVDLTKERLYTISEGTRKTLRAIDEPVDIRVYFSKKLGEAAPSYAKMFERVRTLLEQYSGIARGKLQVTFLDPEPFSDAEDRAVAAGLKGIRLNQEGEMGYFGIVGSNSTDTESNLPFLSTDRERFLEYDVTKLIVTLANQTKSGIGLISGIPIEGSPGNPMMGRPPSPPMLMLEQIREFFELKTIAKDAKEIPADIGVLMVVQPEGLSADTAYAIDQFALVRRQGAGVRRSRGGDAAPGQPHDDDDAGAAGSLRVRQAAEGLGRRIRSQERRRRHHARAPRAVRRRTARQRDGVRAVARPRPPQSRRARSARGRHRAPQPGQRRLPGEGSGRDHPVRPDHPHHRRRHADSRRKRQHDARRGGPAPQLQARRQAARAGGPRSPATPRARSRTARRPPRPKRNRKPTRPRQDQGQTARCQGAGS